MARGPGRPRKSAQSTGNVDVLSELYRPIRVIGKNRMYKTADELAEKINEFFETCMYEGKVPCYSRMLTYLEFRSQSGFEEYANYGEDYAEVIDKAKLLIQSWLEEHLIAHNIKNSTIGVIFTLKNKFGWVDSQHTKSDTTLEVVPRETLQQELERKLARIADSRGTALLAEPVDSEPIDATPIRLVVSSET
jgi:hypothetical protein